MIRECNRQPMLPLYDPDELRTRLREPDWLPRAERCKRRFGYRCALCNSDRQLEAHHRTYARLWHEWDEDLTCLCRPCHKRYHKSDPIQDWDCHRDQRAA